jgi:hypothetical protein
LNKKTIFGLASFLLIPLCLIAVLFVALTITSKWETKKDPPQSAETVGVVYLLEDVDDGAAIPSGKVELRQVEAYKAPENSLTSVQLVDGRKSSGSLHRNSILTVDDLGKAQLPGAATPDQTRKIAGRYYGMCSGQPMVTRFWLDENNNWSGNYVTQADLHSYSGTIDGITLSGENDISAKWHDKFGVGSAHFVFQKDGRSFNASFYDKSGVLGRNAHD